MSAFGNVKGDVTLTRTVNISLSDFRKGVTAPSDSTIGTTPTVPALLFAATNELITGTVAMPPDWDKTKDCVFHTFWSLTQTETNGDSLSITVDYVAPEARVSGAGADKTSTRMTPSVSVTTAEGLAINDIYDIVATISAADANNGFSPSDNVAGFAFEIHLTNTTGVAQANLLGLHLNYEALY